MGIVLSAKVLEENVGDVRRRNNAGLCIHSIDQVKKLCNHAVWINKGTIMQTGDVNTVCDAYMASQTVKASSLQQ